MKKPNENKMSPTQHQPAGAGKDQPKSGERLEHKSLRCALLTPQEDHRHQNKRERKQSEDDLYELGKVIRLHMSNENKMSCRERERAWLQIEGAKSCEAR